MLASHQHHQHTHTTAAAFDDGASLAKDLSTVSEASERSSLSDLVDVKSSSSSSAGGTWKIKKMPKPKVRGEEREQSYSACVWDTWEGGEVALGRELQGTRIWF